MTYRANIIKTSRFKHNNNDLYRSLKNRGAGKSSRLPTYEKTTALPEEARLIVAANPLPNRETPIYYEIATSTQTSEEAWRDRYSNNKQLCETNDQSKRSKDVIVVQDDIIPVVKMLEQAGESWHDRGNRSRWRDSSPELFSDPAECGDGIADSGRSRERAKVGREVDAPGNRDVIEILGLYPTKHQRYAT